MFNKKPEEQTEEKVTKDTNSELKELLLTQGNNDSETGILQIAKSQLTSDLHQRKIARAIELVEKL